MTSDFGVQRFALMQAVSEQVILPCQLKALCLNKMMSDRHGQLSILGSKRLRGFPWQLASVVQYVAQTKTASKKELFPVVP